MFLFNTILPTNYTKNNERICSLLYVLSILYSSYPTFLYLLSLYFPFLYFFSLSLFPFRIILGYEIIPLSTPILKSSYFYLGRRKDYSSYFGRSKDYSFYFGRSKDYSFHFGRSKDYNNYPRRTNESHLCIISLRSLIVLTVKTISVIEKTKR